jgi:hypothetical protein
MHTLCPQSSLLCTVYRIIIYTDIHEQHYHLYRLYKEYILSITTAVHIQAHIVPTSFITTGFIIITAIQAQHLSFKCHSKSLNSNTLLKRLFVFHICSSRKTGEGKKGPFLIVKQCKSRHVCTCTVQTETHRLEPLRLFSESETSISLRRERLPWGLRDVLKYTRMS